MSRPDVAMCFGTWDRLAKLQASVASIRAAAGGLRVVCLVADAGSADGSREWLAAQPDCELLEGGRDGAVKAFNVAYARAVDLGSPWVGQWNDDIAFCSGGGELAKAAARMAADASIGSVTFASDRYGTFRHEQYHGRPYGQGSLIRREAGMAAARFLGDPEGKCWWDRTFHTYASDTVLGLVIWRLGWRVVAADDLRVHDGYTKEKGETRDPLRARNFALYTNAEEFRRRWGDPASCAYHRADAEKFGGRVL